MKEKIHHLNFTLYFVLSLTVITGFYFGEDSSGSGGFIADFNNTWPIMSVIDKGEFFDFSEYTIHFPLHYYILFIINSLVDSKELVRLVFIFFSLFVPYLFFLILKEKFTNIGINKLFFFSQIIFLLPSFRSGAIWANTQITALIFFMISLIYFIKWLNLKSYLINKKLIYQCFFLSLAVYSRQLYALIFIYILYIYFLKLDLKNFIKVCSIIFIFSLPGFFLVFTAPRTLTTTFDFNLINSLVVNTSIISFYLIPIFFIGWWNYLKNLNFSFFQKKNLLIILFSFILVLFSSLNFSYNPSLGGGFFIKLSMIVFNNLIFFYLTSFLGIVFIIFLFKEDKKSMILFFLLVFGLSSYQIFQKYFEPMMIILLFSIIIFSQLNIILNDYKKIIFFKFYFLIYLLLAIVNDIFKITKSFL